MGKVRKRSRKRKFKRKKSEMQNSPNKHEEMEKTQDIEAVRLMRKFLDKIENKKKVLNL